MCGEHLPGHVGGPLSQCGALVTSLHGFKETPVHTIPGQRRFGAGLGFSGHAHRSRNMGFAVQEMLRLQNSDFQMLRYQLTRKGSHGSFGASRETSPFNVEYILYHSDKHPILHRI